MWTLSAKVPDVGCLALRFSSAVYSREQQGSTEQPAWKLARDCLPWWLAAAMFTMILHVSTTRCLLEPIHITRDHSGMILPTNHHNNAFWWLGASMDSYSRTCQSKAWYGGAKKMLGKRVRMDCAVSCGRSIWLELYSWKLRDGPYFLHVCMGQPPKIPCGTLKTSRPSSCPLLIVIGTMAWSFKLLGAKVEDRCQTVYHFGHQTPWKAKPVVSYIYVYTN